MYHQKNEVYSPQHHTHWILLHLLGLENALSTLVIWTLRYKSKHTLYCVAPIKNRNVSKNLQGQECLFYMFAA